MKKIFLTIAAFLMVACLTQTGSASILYTATNNGSGNYTLNYEVVNNWGVDIDFFKIYFGQTSDGLNFTNVWEFSAFTPDDNGVENPAGWFSYSWEPSVINNPAVFNSEGDVDGDGIAETSLAAGLTKTGFSVSFDWTGTGSYDALYYEVGRLQGQGWETLFTGRTARKQTNPGGVVPEPATAILFGLGLLGTAAVARRKNN